MNLIVVVIVIGLGVFGVGIGNGLIVLCMVEGIVCQLEVGKEFRIFMFMGIVLVEVFFIIVVVIVFLVFFG